MRKLFTALTLFTCSTALCQATGGTLVGTILDPSGGVIPGVIVSAAQASTTWTRTAATDDEGAYSLTQLDPGVYRVAFEIEGFKSVRHSEVLIRTNETTRLNLTMDVGSITEIVQVSGTPLLQTDTPGVGATISRQQLEQLPTNGRQIDMFAQLLPGVAPPAPGSHLSSRGGFNVSGIDEHYMSFFLDGLDNVDPAIRNFSYRPPLETVQELRIDQNGYRAEFGRNAGAVISITTIPGTNSWHASAFEYLRNDNLDARNVFALADAPKPSFIRNQYGGTLSGPIKSGRTFVFAAYEGIRQKHGQVRRATVPTERMRLGDLGEFPQGSFLDPATGQPFADNVIPSGRLHPLALEILQFYPLPNRPGLSANRVESANRIEDSDDISARLDHRWTPGTRMMGRFSRAVTRVLDPFRTETGGSVNIAGFGQTADRLRTNVGITLTTFKGDGFVNELRVGYNRFAQPQLPLNPGTPALQPLMGLLETFPSVSPGAADPIGSGAMFRRVANVYNYVDAMSFRHRNHRIKVGVDVRRYLFNAININPNIFTFAGTRTGTATLAGNAMADFLLGLPVASFSFNGSPSGNTRKFEAAGYVQDSWNVGRQFTIDAGLRWEFYGRITERVNKQSLWVPECNCIQLAGADAPRGLVNNDFNNFAPRLGFAWRPRGRRMAVRASFGIFYDNDMRNNFEVVTNPPFSFVREYIFPFTPTLSLSDPFPSSGGFSTLRPATFEKNYRDTYAEHWHLSVQQELGQDHIIDVAYVGNHTLKARRARNVNQPINGVPPYPGFGLIAMFEQAGSSNYHALQVRFERRFHKGLGFLSSYTWGHAIDDRPGQGAGRIPNSYDLRAERGDADYDVRHRWILSGGYELPFGKSTGWGGWNLSGILTVQGGRPITVNLLREVSASGNQADRPNAVPGVTWTPANQNAGNWIDPSAFSTPSAGTFGNLGRNTVRGPQLHNLDVSLMKSNAIGESVSIQWRADVFNLFNHPNLGNPNAILGSPQFGTIAATASPERQIQFGFKLRM